MAQTKITANIKKKELLNKFNLLISEKFESRFFDLITWRIAFILSLKSTINIDELKEESGNEVFRVWKRSWTWGI